MWATGCMPGIAQRCWTAPSRRRKARAATECVFLIMINLALETALSERVEIRPSAGRPKPDPACRPGRAADAGHRAAALDGARTAPGRRRKARPATECVFLIMINLALETALSGRVHIRPSADRPKPDPACRPWRPPDAGHRGCKAVLDGAKPAPEGETGDRMCFTEYDQTCAGNGLERARRDQAVHGPAKAGSGLPAGATGQCRASRLRGGAGRRQAGAGRRDRRPTVFS